MKRNSALITGLIKHDTVCYCMFWCVYRRQRGRSHVLLLSRLFLVRLKRFPRKHWTIWYPAINMGHESMRRLGNVMQRHGLKTVSRVITRPDSVFLLVLAVFCLVDVVHPPDCGADLMLIKTPHIIRSAPNILTRTCGPALKIGKHSHLMKQKGLQ